MSAPTTVCEVKDGEFLSYVITPEQFGFTRCSKDELTGGSPQDLSLIHISNLGTVGFAVGFVLMMVLDVALG